MTDLTSDPKVAGALAALSLEEKVQLLTGRDFWTTWPIEKIGLHRILVSDGPSGVRGGGRSCPSSIWRLSAADRAAT